MTSTEFQSLAAVLNKLLAALGAGITLPEGTSEMNLIQTIDVIASSAESGNDAGDDQETISQQQSRSGPGPTSDFAMANKIAQKQGVPFSQVWRSMPKSGARLTLTCRRKPFGFFRF